MSTTNSTTKAMSKNKIMMLLFVASESFFFLTLIISYVFYSHPGGHLSETAQYLNVKKTSIFTFFLLASSLTIEFADKKLKNGNRKGMLTWLGISILFGAIFLVGQGFEYIELIEQKVTISTNVFGSAFFTLTGFHGFHVFVGLVVLLILGNMVRSKKYQSIEYDAFNTAIIYWHFVDAVWVVVFSVVYIGAII
ncbi:MAG TPA: cytochrome c oxidase subunit 3 [Sunxiuqinia sp.]|nr:cytochrome c oxidase subunit 3 [Sunxiuqinia sp.]